MVEGGEGSKGGLAYISWCFVDVEHLLSDTDIKMPQGGVETHIGSGKLKRKGFRNSSLPRQDEAGLGEIDRKDKSRFEAGAAKISNARGGELTRVLGCGCGRTYLVSQVK